MVEAIFATSVRIDEVVSMTQIAFHRFRFPSVLREERLGIQSLGFDPSSNAFHSRHVCRPELGAFRIPAKAFQLDAPGAAFRFLQRITSRGHNRGFGLYRLVFSKER